MNNKLEVFGIHGIFGADPDSRICTSDKRIWIQLPGSDSFLQWL